MKQLLERKQGTRIIVFALLLTMLAWLAPANVGVAKAAEGDTKMEISLDDDGCHLLFDKDTGAITGCSIKEHITEVDLSKISTSIKIKTIGYYAFVDCSSLTNVKIPNGVTAIGFGAFDGCSGLTSVSIPNGVTTIEGRTFYRCSSLNSVEIPAGVETIGDGAFDGCSGLTSVSIPNSVTTIGGGTFRDCSGLSSVNIPNSVTTIGRQAFDGCSGLSSVSIPNSVTTIGRQAFGYQWDEKEEDYSKVPGFKIYGYSNDSAAAKYAEENGFEYIIVDGGEGNNQQGGSSNDQGNQNDDASNNKGDNSQNNVPAVPGKPATATTKKGAEVKDKKSNGSYVVTQAKKNGGTVTYKKPLNKKKTSVTIPAAVKISGKTYKVTAIEKNAFKDNKKLKTVKIGSNIKKIGVNAFANCKNLKTITIQTKKLTKNTVGANAFKGINNKAMVKVPKGKVKAYQKLLKSKGLSKKAKVK